MDGCVRRCRSPGERRLDRRFEGERVEAQIWVKVYELICPFLKARDAGASKERRLPALVAADRKGA
jgi:hypothetical protein